MIVKNGEIIAINSVKTDNTLSGNGVTAPLGVNTTVVIDPLVSAINRNSQNISAVSAEVNRVSDQVDLLSNALLEEQETREEADERLNTEINKNKQNISVVSAKVDNVAEQVDLLSNALLEEQELREEADERLNTEINKNKQNISAVSAEVNRVSDQVDLLSNALLEEQETREEADERLSAEIDENRQNIGTVSAELDDVAEQVDLLSDALLEEAETREEIDDLLSAAIDTKQDILLPGDNIAIENKTVSVSGTEGIRLHYPLFGKETVDGLVIGVKDHTHGLYKNYATRNIANPIAGQHVYEDWFKIDNNQLMVDERVKNFTLDFSYTVDGNFHPDFIYETWLNVTDASGINVFCDAQTISNRGTYGFSVELDNNSPYSITYAGDTAAFTGMSATISCRGTYWPDYGYLDNEGVDIGDGTTKRILVWDPDVLGVREGTEDIVGANDDTAIGV